MLGTDSDLVVRRSIRIAATPERVWREFADSDRMDRWWGALAGDPEAGTPQGMRLVAYEPRIGGRVEMEVSLDGAPARFGGAIVRFDGPRELTFENDWMPNNGWRAPTHVTLRLTPVAGGTLVEMLHHGFERTGDQAAADHAAYEEGWGMTQLIALRALVESS